MFHFLCFSSLRRRGRFPAFISCQEHCWLARSHQHKEVSSRVEEEHLHAIAVDNKKSSYATLQPPVLPPSAQPQHSPKPLPAARAVHSLTMGKLGQPTGRIPAAKVSKPGSRSKSASRGSTGIAHRPVLPIQVHNYRMERQNGPLPGHQQPEIGCWLSDVQAYESDTLSSYYPTQPAAQRKDQYVSDSD